MAHSSVTDFKYYQAIIDKRFYVSIISLVISSFFFEYALFRIWTLICIVVDHNFDKASISNESKIIGSDNVIG